MSHHASVRPPVTLVSRPPRAAGRPEDAAGTARLAGLAAAIALAAAPVARAAITWDGGNGDGDFASADNWGGTDPDDGNDGTLEDGDLIFAGAVQTTVTIAIDYSGIDSITFAGDADTFTIDGDGGGAETLTFNDGATIVNDSTNSGDMTFGSGLNLAFSGEFASIVNNNGGDDGDIVIESTIDIAGDGSFDLFVEGAGDVSLDGVVSGAGARIVKRDEGTLTLGAANTHTGGVRIEEGTVLLGDAAGFGTGTVVVAGDATVGATGGAIAGVANDFEVLSGDTLTIGGSEDLELDGDVTGLGSVAMNMATAGDVLTLGGDLSGLGGGLTLTRGTLVAETAESIGGAGDTVTVDAAADAVGLRAAVGGLTFAPDFVLQRSGGTAELSLDGTHGFTLAGTISGTGRIEVGVASGQLVTLSAANTFTGGTTIDTAGAGIVLGTGTSLGTGSLSLAADGEIRAGTDLGVVANDVKLGTHTLTVGGTHDLTLGGAISGTGGVTVDAAGATVALTGTSTYTGTTTLTAGTLLFGSDDAIGNGGGGASLALNGGTIGTGGASVSLDEAVAIGGDVAVADLAGGSLTLSGAVDLGDADRTITTANDELFTLSGTVSSTGQNDGLTKAGAGVLVLSGDNSAWNGGVTVSGGSLGLGHDDALGGSGLEVTGDASVFASGGARTIANAVDLNTNVLTIGGTEDLTLSGAITSTGGTGSVRFASTGTTTIGNAGSSYAGTTTIAAGTVLVTDAEAFGTSDLVLAGGALGASGAGVTLDEAVSVTAASTITGDESLTLSGAISGGGDLTVDLAAISDVLTLSGTNTAAGDVQVDGGMLTLAGGDALADTVRVTLADAAAAGLTLSNDETIAGLAGGGSGGGDVALGGSTLTLAGDGDAVFTYGGVISGTGGLTVTGGSHYLGGASTFTGATTVSGGLLGGSGAVGGDLTVATGATLAPGSASAAGTLEVAGDLDLAAGSTLQVLVDGSDLSNVSQVDVAGDVTIASGAGVSVSVSQTAGTYVASDSTYVILTADGTIATPDVAVTTDSATLDFYDLEDFDVADFTPGDDEIALIATRAANAYSNPAVVTAGNNRRIGAALDSLTAVADANPTGDAADLLAQLQALDADQLNAALEQLAPTAANVSTSLATGGSSAYGAVQTGYLAARRSGTEDLFMMAGGRLAMGTFGLAEAQGLLGGAGGAGGATAAGEAMALAGMLPDESLATDGGAGGGTFEAGDWKVFAKIYGVMSEQDAEGNRVGYDGTFLGVQGGVDRRFGDEWVVGLGLAYQNADADLEPNRGDIEADTFRLGPYATWTRGDWYVDLSATVGFGGYDQNRLVTIPMMATQTAVSDYDATDVTLLAGVGREVDLGDGWTLVPQASLMWATYDFDGYTETGAGVNDMTVSDRSADSLRSRLAVELTREIELASGGRLVPGVLLGWEHEFEDFDEVEARFAVGGDPFLADVGSPVEDGIAVGAGLTLISSDRLSGYVRYDGVFGDGSDTHAISGGLELRF